MAAKTGKHLVIVESPAKAKTINKYLGDDYIVKASMGHVRDLPSKGMGVDLETFVPEYEVLETRGKVISELKKLAKTAPDVYLATDLDREGEAIAWHLKEALGIKDDAVRRVIFNAITKTEIKKAFEHPHQLDINRVNAQQARRILDRIVGYEISPVLWRKVARGLSAGRVQSVAVRLIVEREREIEAFNPVEYWKIGALFTAAANEAAATALAKAWAEYAKAGENGDRTKPEKDKWLTDHAAFAADLVEVGGVKLENNLDKSRARQLAEACGMVVEQEQNTEDPEGKGPAKFLVKLQGSLGRAPVFTVRGVERKRSTSRPPAPFITSTLQQSASSRLSYGAQRTMRLAQGLYEAGHITYMRTDSTHLSADSLTMVRGFIKDRFGERYLPAKPNFFASSNKSAQEAHEAIRPTDVTLTPQAAAEKLSPDELKVYTLIWNRFVACQMPPAEFDQTAVTITTQTPVGEAVFRATGRKLVFDGFMKVLGISSEDQILPALEEKQRVYAVEIIPSQHFTQAPPRFTEASLVKELERLGIGRPSTYASIIQTIQDRKYVEQIERRFHATLLGCIVTDKLVQGFPKILDVQFTAEMENKLDQVESEHLDWVKLLKEFYGPFHASVGNAMEILGHAGGTETSYICDKCGSKMVYRISASGFFLACTNRECSATKPVDSQGKPKLREVSEHKCPNCGREMIKRQGRFGVFLGCAGYAQKDEQGNPLCKTIINLDKQGNPQPPKAAPIPTEEKCPKCQSMMYLRDGKRGPWLSCSKFPKCRGMLNLAKLEGEAKAKLEALIPQLKADTQKGIELVAKLKGETVPAAGAAKPNFIPTDIDCSECGHPMAIRFSRRGPFLGCTHYPKCKNTGEVPAKLIEELGLDQAKAGNGKKEAEIETPDTTL